MHDPRTTTPSPDWVVTLVHGTWGRQSPWAFAGSTFATRLEQILLGTVHFERFEWTSENREHDRVSGARKLSARLEKLFASHPHATQVIVAHSHGGNVAITALRESERLQERVAGVVCMGTPFITTEAADLEAVEPAAASAWGFVGCFALWIAAVIGGSLGYFITEFLWKLATSRTDVGSVGTAVALLGGFVGAIAAVSLASAAGESTLQGLRDTKRRIVERHKRATVTADQSRLLSVPVFVATAWGDEAFWGLRRATSAGGIPRGLLTFALTVAVLGFVVGIPLVMFGAFIDDIWQGANLERRIEEVAMAAAYFGLLLTLAVGLVLPPVRMVFIGKGYGMSVVDAIALRVRVALTPAFASNVTLQSLGLMELFRQHGPRAILPHSLVYANASVVSAIGKWIASLRSNPPS